MSRKILLGSIEDADFEIVMPYQNNQFLQLEDGYLRIANELVEILMRTNLTSYQTRVLWVVWRLIYRWDKKEDKISVSQFVRMTGIAKGHVCRTLKELEDRNIIIRNGKVIAFNKVYSEWKELGKGSRPYRKLPNGVSLPNGVTKCYPTRADERW